MGERRARILARPERLAEIHRLGLLDTDAEARLQRVCRLAARLAGARCAQVSVLTDRQTGVGAVGVPAGARVTGLDNSACAVVTATGAPVVSRRAADDPRFAGLPAVRSGSVRRYAGAPLRSGSGESVGVLCVFDDQDADWPADLDAVLDDLTRGAGTELEYAAYARGRAPSVPAAVPPVPRAGDVPPRAAGVPDVPPGLADAGPLLPDYLAVDWARTPLGPPSAWPPALRTTLGLCLVNPLPSVVTWGRELTLLYNAPFAALVGDQHPAALGAPSTGVTWEVWDAVRGDLVDGFATGRGSSAQDVPLPLSLAGEFHERWWSYVRTPVRDESGAVAGILSVVRDSSDRVLAERALRRRTADLELLQQVTAGLATATTAEQIADQVTGHVLPALGAVVATVTRLVGDQVERLSSSPLPTGEDVARRPLDAPVPPCIAIRLGREVVDLTPADRCRRDGSAPWGDTVAELGPAVALPMLVAGTAVGSVALVFPAGRVLGEDDLAVLRAITAQCGQALERARLLEAERARGDAEHRVAEVLQRSLLPVLPQPVPVAVAAAYRPGDTRAQVGGDWYDLFDLGRGRLGVVIGDVMGHDTRAAAAMGQLRRAVRGYAERDLTPARVLERLDRLVDDAPDVDLATCLYAVLDLGDLTLTGSNAGHLPPWCVTGGRAATLAVLADPPLGAGPVRRRDHRVTLPAGALLALVTDGVVESRGQPIEAGLERLGALLAGSAADGVDAVRGVLLGHLESAGPVEDDSAFLLLGLPGAAAARRSARPRPGRGAARAR